MKNLSTLMLGASLAAGCQGEIQTGRLDPNLSAQQCFNNLTRGEVNLAHQETDAIQVSASDANVSLDGDLTDVLRFVDEGVLRNSVLLGAIENLGGDNSTVEIGNLDTRSSKEDFGDEKVTTESPIVDASIDFSNVPSLDGATINYVVTDPTCETLRSDVFQVAVQDYGYENNYYAEEQI